MANKKWYSYFVVTDESQESAGTSIGAPPESTAAARRVSDLAPEAPVVGVPDAVPVDLGVVYEAAKIQPPAHGYTVLKVAEMLSSEHLTALPGDVKRKSILVALEAAGVTIEEIVQDAVRRDRALDTYEKVLDQHFADLEARLAAENTAIEEQIARQAAELRARIDQNRRALEAEAAELAAWRARKQREEAAIAEAVGHFVTENPITAAPAASQGDRHAR